MKRKEDITKENKNMQELDVEDMGKATGGAAFYATDNGFEHYANIAKIRRAFPGGRQAEPEMMKLRSFAFRGMSDEEIETAYQEWKKKKNSGL